jgi:Family of unknown function (DUF5677)
VGQQTYDFNMDKTVRFGFPEEWDAFSRRNQKFLELFPSLQAAFDKHLIRTAADTTVPDRIILLLGRHCLEDFMEVMLLAGNGYGVGALKIVRGLYERAVTIAYLVENPDQTDDFVDYARVERFKAVSAWVEANPKDAKGLKVMRGVRARYDEVKERFRDKKTWSGIDFVSMARATGSLGKLLVEAYYQPLAHAHGTAQALVSRLEMSEERGFEFVGDAQTDEADSALLLAHKIMIYVLGAQLDHFHPGDLDETVQVCLTDFVAIWRNADGTEESEHLES